MVTIRIRGLAFHYDTRPVFSDTTIEVDKGEVLSIVGRNGAGKSTLLKCINHILTPAEGAVLVDDQDVAAMNLKERARRFGYLAQRNQHLFPTTVFDVVLTGRYAHSPVRFTRRDEEITAEVLARMELGDFARRPFHHLSGGEQQQVLIARALAQGADILLFDEPTNNLDLRHQLQIMRLIRDIARNRRITSLLAIHDLNLAAAFSDKVIMLHKGGVFAGGKPSEVFTHDNIREVFGVDVKIYDHGGTPHVVMLDGSLPG